MRSKPVCKKIELKASPNIQAKIILNLVRMKNDIKKGVGMASMNTDYIDI